MILVLLAIGLSFIALGIVITHKGKNISNNSIWNILYRNDCEDAAYASVAF